MLNNKKKQPYQPHLEDPKFEKWGTDRLLWSELSEGPQQISGLGSFRM
jgi:hypothetical protein